MDSKIPFTALASPIFNGEGYQVWIVRMEAHLWANDFREAIEEDYEVLSLAANPTMAHTKNHKERKLRKSKAIVTLFVAVSYEIFLRIMTMKLTFEV
ncbi:hypothetical protein PVK06_027408 [Gossypium arboreum]|uniref:DUF4219 domain-containing protein n=1 Tax=Gossypium arboreum TaxID=29729 RepID=A0ABR0P094_GOSAR|nr:hypothetical protein PVK06_027408 [Gossypium arboreum]